MLRLDKIALEEPRERVSREKLVGTSKRANFSKSYPTQERELAQEFLFAPFKRDGQIGQEEIPRAGDIEENMPENRENNSEDFHRDLLWKPDVLYTPVSFQSKILPQGGFSVAITEMGI